MRLREGSWDQMAEVVAERLIDQLTVLAPNCCEIVGDWRLVTPESITDRFGLTEWHMHHTDMTLDQVLAQRPAPGWADYRTPVQGLYLGGSGCHPGGWGERPART